MSNYKRLVAFLMAMGIIGSLAACSDGYEDFYAFPQNLEQDDSAGLGPVGAGSVPPVGPGAVGPGTAGSGAVTQPESGNVIVGNHNLVEVRQSDGIGYACPNTLELIIPVGKYDLIVTGGTVQIGNHPLVFAQSGVNFAYLCPETFTEIIPLGRFTQVAIGDTLIGNRQMVMVKVDNNTGYLCANTLEEIIPVGRYTHVVTGGTVQVGNHQLVFVKNNDLVGYLCPNTLVEAIPMHKAGSMHVSVDGNAVEITLPNGSEEMVDVAGRLAALAAVNELTLGIRP